MNSFRKIFYLLLATLVITSSTALAQEQEAEKEKPQRGKRLLDAAIKLSDAMDQAAEKSDQEMKRKMQEQQEQQKKQMEEEQERQKQQQEQQKQQGKKTAENISGKWESYGWTCCDQHEGAHGGWVGPAKLEFTGNKFVLVYEPGYPPDDRYVPERTRKGTFAILGERIEFTLDDGRVLTYPFSQSGNDLTIDRSQRFSRPR